MIGAAQFLPGGRLIFLALHRIMLPMHWAAYFLPKVKREAIAALELFVRDMRGALAGGGECCGGEGDGGLAGRAVDQLYAGCVSGTMTPLVEAVRRAGVPRQWFVELMQGLADETRIARYATWSALRRHLSQAGGNIGRIVSAILGATHSDACVFAEALGVASSLTSILVELRCDASRGLIRLPLEDLARFRYSERQLLAGESNGPLRELIRLEVARARELFRDGSSGICWLAGDGSRMAVSALVASQLAVLDAIERANFDVLQGDLALSPARKLRQLPVAWRLAKRSPDEPMPREIGLL